MKKAMIIIIVVLMVAMTILPLAAAVLKQRMKRLFLLITLILLSACSSKEKLFKDSLLNLGYKEEEIELISSLSEQQQAYFIDTYNAELLNYLNDEDFISTNLDLYLKYDELSDYKTIIYLVNNDYFSNNLTSDLLKDKFFILKNIDKYLEYGEYFANIRDIVEYVNTKSYLKGYEDYVNADTNQGNLILANKLNYLGDYTPEDLVTVDSDYYMQGEVMLQAEAYEHLKEMFDDARKEKLYFYISTAYRSFDFQTALYNSYLVYDSQEVVDTYSSRPGFSDHQTGLACDIGKVGYKFSSFTDTPECKWLHENAYKYGFILRYPEGKENITKYTYESWHFRYVGIDASTFIHDNNITLEEYYAFFVENI